MRAGGQKKAEARTEKYSVMASVKEKWGGGGVKEIEKTKKGWEEEL